MRGLYGDNACNAKVFFIILITKERPHDFTAVKGPLLFVRDVFRNILQTALKYRT